MGKFISEHGCAFLKHPSTLKCETFDDPINTLFRILMFRKSTTATSFTDIIDSYSRTVSLIQLAKRFYFLAHILHKVVIPLTPT